MGRATQQALSDVKKPHASQLRHSDQGANPADPDTKILMGVVWCTTESLKKSHLFPEIASMDSTCKTNKEGRPLFRITGIDGDGKLFTRASALLGRKRRGIYFCVAGSSTEALGTFSVRRRESDYHRRRSSQDIRGQGCFMDNFHQCDQKKMLLASSPSRISETVRMWRH